MNPNNIRTFIALELDERIRLKIKKIQDHLKNIDADITWVKPENIHLTLKFLGNVPGESIEKISDAICQVAKNISSFDLELTNYGYFPKNRSPQVLWINVDEGKDSIKKIAAALASPLEAFCEKVDNKEFSPHITIGRVKSNKNISQLLAEFSKPPASLNETQKVRFVTLFKSDLKSSGPEYTVIKRLPLI